MTRLTSSALWTLAPSKLCVATNPAQRWDLQCQLIACSVVLNHSVHFGQPCQSLSQVNEMIWSADGKLCYVTLGTGAIEVCPKPAGENCAWFMFFLQSWMQSAIAATGAGVPLLSEAPLFRGPCSKRLSPLSRRK